MKVVWFLLNPKVYSRSLEVAGVEIAEERPKCLNFVIIVSIVLAASMTRRNFPK